MNAPETGMLHPLTTEEHRRLLMRSLNDMICNDRFDSGLSLHYQPFICMSRGCIVGAEALLRWQSPWGTISPARFVPMVTELDLTVEFGRMVISQAVSDMAVRFPDDFSVSINIEAEHFSSDTLTDDVLTALNARSVAPHRLEVELTENATLDRVAARPTLSGLRHAGVRILLDDFGTGHNSLVHLSEGVYDGIKLDRLFVSRMLQHRNDYAIIRSLTSLAKEIGAEVIAEGVENKEILESLKQMHVHRWQGYLCAPAIPAGQLVEMIQHTNPVVY